jgi:hypothetical protein
MVKIQILLNIQKWAHLAHNPMAHNPLCRICFFVSTPTVSLLLPPVTYSSSARDLRAPAVRGAIPTPTAVNPAAFHWKSALADGLPSRTRVRRIPVESRREVSRSRRFSIVFPNFWVELSWNVD